MKTCHAFVEPLENRIAPARIFATNSAKELLEFDSATPGTVARSAITGLLPTERIEGIDFRPSTGELYLLAINDTAGSDEGRIYVLNLFSKHATMVGPGAFFNGFAEGASYGFDFDPVNDRIRVVNTADQNYIIPNPDDLGFPFAAANLADSSFDEEIYSMAYDRNFDGGSATTVYGIEYLGDRLVRIGDPDNGQSSTNIGVVTVIGSLGLTANNRKGGFDIDDTGAAFAVILDNPATSLFRINLITGAATSLGAVGDGSEIITGMSVAPTQTVKIVNPKTATYTDEDGDLVTVKVTKGTLSAQDFLFATKEGGGLQLRQLDLTGQPEGAADFFAGTNVTITAKAQAGKGDGFAHVGYIKASGVDLGAVTVGGDLARINAGDTNTAKKSPALKALTVHSMGVLNTATAGLVFFDSTIQGALGKLTVKTDLAANIGVHGNGTDADGTVGTVSIGGDIYNTNGLSTGGLVATGNIGKITVLGSMLGDDDIDSIRLKSKGDIGTITIGGSLVGGTGVKSGYIEAAGKIGKLTIGGDLQGGPQNRSGYVEVGQGIGTLTVRGSIIGGQMFDPTTAQLSGYVLTHASGTAGNIGTVKVGGSLIGGDGGFSGGIDARGTIKSVTIGGSLVGGDGYGSGSLAGGEGFGTVKIAGSVIGGTKDVSGSLYASQVATAPIGSITIGGSLTAQFVGTGIFSSGTLGAVKIGGNLTGQEFGEVTIRATGIQNPANAAQAVSIKSVTVRGNVSHAVLLAGTYNDGTGINPDAQIGAITVGGNWIASSAVAGIASSSGYFGDADDVAVNDPTPSDNLFSKIGSITIKGLAVGTFPGPLASADSFGFVAQQIGKLKIGTSTYPLTAAQDLAPILLGSSGDFRVREVA